MNHFYQEYIANKEHIHLNATRWPSLTEFWKHLGRESICRCEETDKGLMIAWIDNSPEALRRADAVRKKERQDRGEEEREQAAIRQQIERAEKAKREEGGGGNGDGEEDEDDARKLERVEGEKLKLAWGTKPKVEDAKSLPTPNPSPEAESTMSSTVENTLAANAPSNIEPPKASFKMSTSTKPKNVFAAAKKNALGVKKPIVTSVFEQPKKMSEAERIMKEEIERKGKRGFSGPAAPPQKKMRL